MNTTSHGAAILVRYGLWFLALTFLVALGSGVDHASSVFAADVKQAKASSFFHLQNLVTVRITMPPADWLALKNAQPHGGATWVGSRFDWFKATSVEIQTTQFPSAGSFTFANVGIKKKSWLGSFSTTKPSFHLRYDKYDDHEAAVENLIGTKYLMFNNSIQDGDYIRQCLGYRLFGDAGLPAARCNFARVVVNGTELGVYVNVEPVEKRFAAHNFAGNDDGNVYEFEVGEDFDANMLYRTDFDGFSSHSDKKDLILANARIAAGDYASVIDEDHFVRLWAMEILLKHWDGYAGNRNNTYAYNDVVAVANPGVAEVNFKLVPSGIDQILQPWRTHTLYQTSVLASKLAASPPHYARLRAAVHVYLNTVLGYHRYTTSIVPYINASVAVVNTLLSQAGSGPLNANNISAISSQLADVRSRMNALFGFAFTLANADYDGDGKTDLTVRRPSQAKFYTTLSVNGWSLTPVFGAAGDIPVAGDFDGDGRVDHGLWRPSTGTWDIVHSSTGLHVLKQWGTAGDVPVVGDFDGDGKADLTVWRPSQAKFYTILSSNGGSLTPVFGASGDVPVVGNFDGDGKTDYALWRPSTGTWDVLHSSTGLHVKNPWGTVGDVPVVGDFDGDGKADLTVWRPSQAKFYTILSSNGGTLTPVFGASGDVPVIGNFDADAKSDYALWRPSTGTWDVLHSSTGLHVKTPWGTSGDIPVPRPQN